MLHSPMPVRKWTVIAISIIIAVLSVVYTFNYIIDPFGSRSWVVEQRYKPIVKERSEKYNYIFYQGNIKNFDSLIMGSSRAMKIVPSNHPQMKHCYNFAFSMASNREKLFILNEWLKYKTPKTLYLGIDFLNFHHEVEHPNQPVESRFIQGNEGNYLSHYALKMGIKSLKNSIKNRPETFFEFDGSINYYADDQRITNGTFDFSLNRYRTIAESIYEERFVKLPYRYTTKSLDYLREIKNLCDAHRIKLVVFIPPEQLEATKMIVADPHVYQNYRRYKRDVVNMFGTVYDFSGGWEENRNTENFYDVWHYRSILADKMVKRFYGVETFGIILTKDNIDDYLIHFHEKIN